MSERTSPNYLDRAVDHALDHVLGPAEAEITLVEYGSYDCPHCRAANEELAKVRDRFGNRLRYVFRHRPVTGSDIARRAAELVEQCDAERFWEQHIQLMTRSTQLTEDDLRVVGASFGASQDDGARVERARARVEEDLRSARNSGVTVTPTFYINGRRYDGPWDESSLADAMLGSLGHRVSSAALDFASWAPSTGVLLLIATVVAVALSNSPLSQLVEGFWERKAALAFGDAAFAMSLRHWVNDALLSIFFLVVGLEIKREFTVGHLANRRAAALPVAAALGGMAVPALVYAQIVGGGPWSQGWGVPMATDTAFAVALIVMMGDRVPVALRIFLTAAAIVDDIGSILVVAFFYSGDLHVGQLFLGALATGALALLNRSGVYRVLPYALLGIALWIFVHAGGLHATLAGVVLAFFIPTRPPPNLRALTLQADAIIQAESRHGDEVLRHGPSLPALRAIDAIHDRLESPADRLLRSVEPWSSYVVLPLFALANAGVALGTEVLDGRAPLALAIVAGLTLGKPVGLLLASLLAVALGVAVKPDDYSWRQLAGAGGLAGIGFTMSLFIAGQAFPLAADFSAAKVAIFAASVLSAFIGIAILWHAAPPVKSTVDEGEAVRAENRAAA